MHVSQLPSHAFSPSFTFWTLWGDDLPCHARGTESQQNCGVEGYEETGGSVGSSSGEEAKDSECCLQHSLDQGDILKRDLVR